METKLIVGCLLAATIAAGSAFALGPSAEEVQSKVRGAYVFEVTPSPEGRVANCVLVGPAMAPNGMRKAPDTPSPTFVSSACEGAFAKAAHWDPVAKRDGSIRTVKETCLWSEAVPDQAICRSELGLSFAEEIPRGAGNIVILELVANSEGEAVSCEFSEMSSLSTLKKLRSKPHDLFLQDACRKLKSILWKNPDTPPGDKFYFPCRQIKQVPVRAFCEKDFGL